MKWRVTWRSWNSIFIKTGHTKTHIIFVPFMPTFTIFAEFTDCKNYNFWAEAIARFTCALIFSIIPEQHVYNPAQNPFHHYYRSFWHRPKCYYSYLCRFAPLPHLPWLTFIKEIIVPPPSPSMSTMGGTTLKTPVTNELHDRVFNITRWPVAICVETPPLLPIFQHLRMKSMHPMWSTASLLWAVLVLGILITLFTWSSLGQVCSTFL